MDGIPQKKQRKMVSLLESAYELFLSQGVNDTSIDDIVKRASVAKGTFYLYFKDKNDLLDRVVLRKSAAVIDMALDNLQERMRRESLDFEERVVCFTDFIVGYLRHDRAMLRVLYKNLSRGLFTEAVRHPETTALVEKFCKDLSERGYDDAQARQILYIIVEMVGAVCYSTLEKEQPCTLDEIKPTLYLIIRKLLR